MPRKKLTRSSVHYYHVVTRANHRHWFNAPMNQLWEMASNCLRNAQSRCSADIAQFVLMQNHYHLLIKTPDANLDLFMYWLNKNLSTELRALTALENRMFGGRYKSSLITTSSYLSMAYRYIYQNPLRANIVSKCEDYPYSTLFYEARELLESLPFKVNSLLNELEHAQISITNTTEWINEVFSANQNTAIKKGFLKSNFKPVTPRKY